VEVVLVERAAFFTFAPTQLRYLFGLVALEDVKRDWVALARQGLPVLRGVVIAVDRDQRRVITSEGAIPYDYLALGSGIRLATEEIPGLAERPGLNLCPYETGAVLLDLRERIARFRGGHVVIGTPSSPYKCPPAPYEYALLWADHIARRGLKARVTLVDPRSRPTPAALAPGLTRAIEARERVLDYEPFAQIRSVDPAASTVDTEAGRLAFDLLSVVPPNTAPAFVAEAGLGAPFLDVDPVTFRSTRDERIYAVGDLADTPYAKTAHTAMDAGRIAGEWIARDLGATRRAPGLPTNVCYPLVAADRALRIETHWAREDGAGPRHVRASGTTDSRATASHVRLRRAWEARALSTLFGR
jgi:sulfide:quinone oxidoreductase